MATVAPQQVDATWHSYPVREASREEWLSPAAQKVAFFFDEKKWKNSCELYVV